jgi:PAS domain S-box-containing protein
LDLEAPGARASIIRRAVYENHIIESDSGESWDNLPKGAWDVAPRHILDVPIKAANKQFPLAVLTIGLNPYRKFDNAYKNFIQLIADQISLGVNNTIAYEAERKRAKALEELDKAKTLFFTNISHEFRTPLMLILGPLEELLSQSALTLGDAEKQRITVTHRNALRLLKLVNALLDFSRIESGRHLANFVQTDIAAYTKNLAANFRSVIEKADLRFDVRADEGVPFVYLDKQMWEKIVFNLLSNAFKYTLAGTITLSLKAENDAVILCVEDTGVGIPKAELPRIFERFHRVENAVGRTYEGTGIGLSLVKELVHQHQGTIEVQSVEGKGSTFIVSLPVGKAHLPYTQIFEKDPQHDIAGSNVYLQEAETFMATMDKHYPDVAPETASSALDERDLVMIVDDNADMRQHIESLIATKYRTVTATNGLDALKKIAEQRPILVLSDIMMPEVDGIELLRRLKSKQDTAHIPVVLITARAGEESKIEGYEIGADDYLVKPFSANEMLARIKAQIKIYNARKRIEKRLEGFLMQMPAAVMLVEGPDFRFVMANTMFQKTFDRSWPQLQGTKLGDAFPELEKQGVLDLYKQVYESGVPYVQHEMPLSWLHGGKTKSAYFDIVIYPVMDGSNKVSELMVHAVDISKQVLARKEIEASEEKFRTLTETLPQLVWMTTADGKLAFSSQRWLEYAGVFPSDSETWNGIVHPEDLPNIVEQWDNSRKSGETYRVEARLRSGDGQYRWHFGQGEPIKDEAGEIINWIGAFTDIHDQRLFTEQLEQNVEQRTQALIKANKELESFNYIAGHDLQEPLRKIQTFIHMIRKSNFEENASELYYQKINSSAQRMSDLIQSVLSYSRLAKTGDDHSQVDLNKILKDIEVDFELMIAEKNARITAQDLPTIAGNKFQLNQLFSNLISNSLKFSTVEPEINITSAIVNGNDVMAPTAVSPGGQFHKLTFSDNGIGFEQEFSEKIFSLFQRLHGKNEYSGTGIGLSIVKKIVEQHNGYIAAESSPGQGAMFNIWLPV